MEGLGLVGGGARTTMQSVIGPSTVEDSNGLGSVSKKGRPSRGAGGCDEGKAITQEAVEGDGRARLRRTEDERSWCWDGVVKVRQKE